MGKNKYKIVCVDDEESSLNVTKDILESSFNYEIFDFSSPAEAITYITTNPTEIACVISDMEMPEINGFEFRYKIIEQGLTEIPFLIVSGMVDLDISAKALELKIGGLIRKPVEQDLLIEKVAELAGERILVIEEELELRSSFIEESEPMLEEIENLILGLESSPDDVSILNTYFRLLHTVKGTAACVGLNTISKFTHKYEDLVSKLKNENLPVNKEIIDILLKGLDILKDMCEGIKQRKKSEFDISDLVTIFNIDHIDFSKKEAPSPAGGGGHDMRKDDDEKINVSVNLLDNFLVQSGEMTVLRNMILRNYKKLEQKFNQDKDLEGLGDILDEFHKVSSSVQSNISELRKLGLNAVFKPLKRVVRDVCSAMGKKTNFETEGEELRVDNSIAKILNGSLVHLIRNAVDHGLETVEEREAAGKDPIGNIALKVYEEGEYIKVELKDDGKGINPKVLKEKAIEKQLFTAEELGKMSTHQIFALIFNSGFSTAKKVTDISGRGVGMDMVRSSVEDFGGRIAIDSEVGKGTTFLITLPIPRSVLIITSLMVKVGDLKMAIPTTSIDEVVLKENWKENEALEHIDDSYFFRQHGELIPVLNIGKILEIHNRSFNDFEDLTIVVVKEGGSKFGIMVDEVHDIEETVSKRVAPQIQQLKMILGATLIGDNEVGIILDLKGFAELASIQIEDEMFDDFADSSDLGYQEENDYMLLELLGKKTWSIPLNWVTRLEEFQTSKVEWSADAPLIRYRENVLPLIFTERLLELSKKSPEEFVKNNEVLHVIVISKEDKFYGLVVDSILDIGKSNVALDTSVVEREGFMGTVVIDEATVTVIDPEYLIEYFRKTSELPEEPVDQVA